MSRVDYLFLERLDETQWTPIFFSEAKKDDILRMFDRFGNLKRFSNNRWLLVANKDAWFDCEINEHVISFDVFGE